MKKINILIITMMTLLLFPLKVDANSISSINMDIYIDQNGTAHITETWDAELDSGTEGYKPYYNLGNAKITNFHVIENNIKYSEIVPWNTHLDFEQKANKYGINYINDGLELCWGIGSYGKHRYQLNYNIEGFILSAIDADIIYWNLIPYELSSKPKNVTIKIYSEEKYDDALDVWGYGNYGGTAYVYDGAIEMSSEGELDSNEYMTILAKFPKGTFQTYNYSENNFDYYFQMAETGAKKYKKNIPFTQIIYYAIIIVFNVGIGLIIFWTTNALDNFSVKRINNKRIAVTAEDKKLPKNIPNNRDIPFNKDIFRTYIIAECYDINSKKEDFLGAILLKWLLEDKIRLINGKKISDTSIDMTGNPKFTNKLELELFEMMKNASGDNILESKEFEKYCNKNYSKIYKWYDKVLYSEVEKLKDENKVKDYEEKVAKIISIRALVLDSSTKEDAIQLKGLKNFLEEFSRIDKKDAIEVKLWEYYLIYAQILGIADKVEKQFKKLYPELYNEKFSGYTYDELIFIRSVGVRAAKSATTSKARAESYSSGGGGFSSGGGGGGSFGGGGGGGGFR